MALDVEALIVAHQAGVWRYLRYLGCDRAQADDLTQETFLQVLRHGFEQRGERETAAYLRKVARNCFLMSVRRTRHVQ
ncbi:MAG TPA: sigma-70 family RNA polymerase sigma factor, partial [Planctomycetota bacterium]|nr:sigma-70 family RNA polymerase sigma factor [Planctomycetota bacterium]